MFNSDNPTATMDMFCLVISAFAIIMGIYQIYKKQLFGSRNKDYTPESIAKFAPIEGWLYVAIGLVGVVMSLSGYGFIPTFIFWAGMVLVIGGIVADAILIRKMLKPTKEKEDINIQKRMLR